MPIYEYFCNDCENKLELLKKICDRNLIVKCSKCSSPMSRQLSLFGVAKKESMNKRKENKLKTTSNEQQSAIFKIKGGESCYISDIHFTNSNPSDDATTKYRAIAKNSSARIEIIGDNPEISSFRMKDVQLEGFDTAVSVKNTTIEGENIAFKDVKNAIEYKTEK